MSRALLFAGAIIGPVTVSVQQYKTNALGQVKAMVAVGTQMRQVSGWVGSVSNTSNHFNLSIDPDPLLSPHAERVVPVLITTTASQWPVCAMWQKEYPEHWSKSVR